MTGLVPMHEYRRVVEERDALEARLAAEVGDVSAFGVGLRRRALTRALGKQRKGASWAPLLEELCRRSFVPARSNWERTKCYAANGRRALREAGYAGPDAIICVANAGYSLAPEARDWLRAKVPDAFPATKEPSR